MLYNETDWLNILAKVATNASLTKDLLGDDVTEENLPAKLAELIRKKQQALAEKLAKEKRDRPMTQAQQREYMQNFVKNQSSAVYNTRWSMTQVKRFTNAQLIEKFERI